jgi:UDP-GlcNAc:undecaprenyl-phosphate/decaprenyl-phosphate GlcNAc-1-phosphate transferase
MISIITFLTSMAVTAAVIPAIIYFSKRYNIYDRIDERKVHNRNVSNMGGLAIFAGFTTAFFIIDMPESRVVSKSLILVFAMTLAFLTGLVDDLLVIRARYKLVAQILIGVLVSLSDLNVRGIYIFDVIQIDFGFFSHIFTVCWVVLFMNAINLLDGMDGLAAGVVLIASAFLLIISIIVGDMSMSFLTLMAGGAAAGFLIFNFPPAKIFMGDGGAYFLGFLFAIASLDCIVQVPKLRSVLSPILLMLVPLADIMNVVIRRLRDGSGIFHPDRNHFHHKLQNIGMPQKRILFIAYTFTFLLGLFSILISKLQGKYPLAFFLLAVLTAMAAGYFINSTGNHGKNGSGKKNGESVNG